MSEPKDAAWRQLLRFSSTSNRPRRTAGFGKGQGHESRRDNVYGRKLGLRQQATGRRSTSGSMTFVHGAVSWKSHVQNALHCRGRGIGICGRFRSGLEKRYSSRTCSGNWGVLDTKPTLYTDSKGCIQVSKDPAKHWKLKHIEHQVPLCPRPRPGGRCRHRVHRHQDEQADILTKPLPKVPLSLAGQRVTDTALRWAVEDTTAECSGKQDGDGPES